ncbi:putative PHD type zinc finger protein with BAH domain-containing protein [Coemansia brasiliensis]|uniref:PHD type zinc finger protein with BAH domain-containing protein n=1 Tax=Coemansia brasiliensis TaxID=2650707 RepID=A0A9W8M2N2_9FUNG|nr:putative PHD type zinc finger protein with BAH domain-containing protein [Coemansia brasiliensis]
MSRHLPLSNSETLPPPPASVTIGDGTTVSVDEYVYLQSEYPEEPYYIGRVMEFVYVPRVRKPKPLLSTGSIQKQLAGRLAAGDRDKERETTPTPAATPDTTAQLRVRLAWLQRPRDLPLTRVRAKDARLLVATMHTDINPVSAIRGKCFVRHVSEISDMNAWKAQPDHYHYSQLFDRYSTRLYDIVPVSQIRNAPQEVLQKLRDTYEFIFAETQKINDLVSTRRACTVCAKWCSISESVKCSLCDRHYHLQCLDPPPTRKPAKGYGWQCAACLRRIQEQRARSSEEAGNDSASSAASGNGTADTNDRKRITRNMAAEEMFGSLRSTSLGATPIGTPGAAGSSDNESRPGSKRLKLSHGDSRLYGDSGASPIPRPKNRGLWPFRYFGINTDIEDVLHDDERIYPRAVSRIGPKYQAIVPDMVSPSGAELDRQLVAARAKSKQAASKGKGSIMGKATIMEKTSSIGRSIAGQAGNSHHRWSRDGGVSGGGGGTARWHGKNAEQMDRTWDEIEQRRGSHDEQLFFRKPTTLPNEELDMYMEAIIPFLQRHFSEIQDFTLLDCQDAALHGLALHNYDVEEALISIPDCPEGYIRQRESGDLWSPDRLARFNECLREFGSNLQTVHEHMRESSRRAITLHYYLLRPTVLGKQLLEAYDNRSHAGQRRPNLGQGESAVNVHVEVASDAANSVANTPGSSPRLSGAAFDRPTLRCINCLSSHSTKWTSAPLDFVSYNTRSGKSSAARRVICDQCREFWQHYAMMPDQDVINSRKSHIYAHGTNTRNAHMRDEPRRPRGRPSLVPSLPKMRASESWTLSPCDVCRKSTDGNPELAPLMCRDCGVCVHYGCSGYPDGAVLNPKRWKCGICTNATNPTVSTNYACILCRKDPATHAGGLPQQMMWRTKGNNWVHPLCALATPETRLTFNHGNVIVTGTSTISHRSWTRGCCVCRRSGGAVPRCFQDGCDVGAHPTCVAPFAASGSEAADTALPAGLALRPTVNSSLNVEALLDDVNAFIANGGSIAVVVKCSSHRVETEDVAVDALDKFGRPVMEAAIASKVAKPAGTSRGSLLLSSVAQSQKLSSTPPLASTGEPEHPKHAINGDIKPRLPSPEPSPVLSQQPSAMTIELPSSVDSKAVVWSSAAENPLCSQCSATFSPIWWPFTSSTKAEMNGSSNVPVLCHRCYSAGSANVVRRNIASS